jgi:hypothetical protein
MNSTAAIRDLSPKADRRKSTTFPRSGAIDRRDSPKSRPTGFGEQSGPTAAAPLADITTSWEVSPMEPGVYQYLFVMLALGLAAPASAEDDDGTCRNGGFPMENAKFGVAVVKGAGRAYLLYDMDGCPAISTRCQKVGEGYILPGDKVATGRAMGDYVCAYYPSRDGGSAGWVEKSRLRPLPIEAKPLPSTWLGAWSDEGNPAMSITQEQGSLHVVGESYWPGRSRRKEWPLGWPHTGEIDGTLTLLGNRASYDDDGCKIELTLVGDFLVAADNRECGGANVNFDGVYRRVRSQVR